MGTVTPSPLSIPSPHTVPTKSRIGKGFLACFRSLGTVGTVVFYTGPKEEKVWEGTADQQLFLSSTSMGIDRPHRPQDAIFRILMRFSLFSYRPHNRPHGDGMTVPTAPRGAATPPRSGAPGSRGSSAGPRAWTWTPARRAHRVPGVLARGA